VSSDELTKTDPSKEFVTDKSSSYEHPIISHQPNNSNKNTQSATLTPFTAPVLNWLPGLSLINSPSTTGTKANVPKKTAALMTALACSSIEELTARRQASCEGNGSEAHLKRKG
jgi:hypothetical protein